MKYSFILSVNCDKEVVVVTSQMNNVKMNLIFVLIISCFVFATVDSTKDIVTDNKNVDNKNVDNKTVYHFGLHAVDNILQPLRGRAR